MLLITALAAVIVVLRSAVIIVAVAALLITALIILLVPVTGKVNGINIDICRIMLYIGVISVIIRTCAKIAFNTDQSSFGKIAADELCLLAPCDTSDKISLSLAALRYKVSVNSNSKSAGIYS